MKISQQLKLFLSSLVVFSSVNYAAAVELTAIDFKPAHDQRYIEQVSLRFNAAAVAFGDPQLTAPLLIRCGTDPDLIKNPLVTNTSALVQGTGHWNNSQEWVFDFATELPSDMLCLAYPNPHFSGLNGAKLSPKYRRSFSTGKTYIRALSPYQAEENQIFKLTLTNRVDEASLLANTACQLEGIGEDIGIELIKGEELKNLLAGLKKNDVDDADLDTAAVGREARYYLRCKRSLANDKYGSLVIKAGLKSAKAGIVNQTAESVDFRIRPKFNLKVSCQRLTASRPCLPTSPIELSFTEPITKADAESISLSSSKGNLSAEIIENHDVEKANAKDYLVSKIKFAPSWSEKDQLKLQIANKISDASGRALSNQDQLPLQIKTDAMPALLKFATAKFGILELHAIDKQPPLLPISVRGLGLSKEQLANTSAKTQLKVLNLQDDLLVLNWFAELEKYQGQIAKKYLSAKNKQLFDLIAPSRVADYHDGSTDGRVSASLFPLLDETAAQELTWPQPDNGQVLTNIGIPLKAGFNVVEASAPQLDKFAQPNLVQMRQYERTSVLVTNLAVHFKKYPNGATVLVTQLDSTEPVKNATVRVLTKKGHFLDEGQTNADGLAEFTDLPAVGWDNGYFISATATDSKTGQADYSFVLSDWNNGIEPWRFSVKSGYSDTKDLLISTVLDRSLFRAGETVHMKHILRQNQLDQLGFAKAGIEKIEVEHDGSGQRFNLAFKQLSQGNYASQFQLPKAAKLGSYTVKIYTDANGYAQASGSFQVEAFRLPVFTGVVKLVDKKLLKPTSAAGQVQLNFINSGPAGGVTVAVSAQAKSKDLYFADFDDYSFSPVDAATSQDLLDKQRLELDKNGQADFTLTDIKWSQAPLDLTLTATFADPNGEVQSLTNSVTLWNADRFIGINLPYSSKQTIPVKTVVVDKAGQRQANSRVTITAEQIKTYTIRKRLVGGLYSYQHETEKQELGEVCSGTTDSLGEFSCQVANSYTGKLKFSAQTSDTNGNQSTAERSMWVDDDDYYWFAVEDNNRIDIIPDKNSYQPGDTARLQVKTPFRKAKLWLTVERDGILQSQFYDLTSSDPYVEVKIDKSWQPNVTVSGLLLRGRVYAVSWRDFFSWGWRSPLVWFKEWWGGDAAEYKVPEDLIDLSKPTYRLGAVGLAIDAQEKLLNIEVKPEHSNYQIRDKAKVDIFVKDAAGQAVKANLAVAVVDQALLELKANSSWQLYRAMYPWRSWRINTYTAQMQVVGRRHFGVKAAAPGGDGDSASHKANNRELFDTLLFWQPQIQADEQGHAQIEVPLNDSLTQFKIIAVADYQADQFGTGEGKINVSQDLQIISGLPPVVREGDNFRSSFTLRNSTAKAMDIEVSAQIQAQPEMEKLTSQQVKLAPNSTSVVSWQVKVPQAVGIKPTSDLVWQVQASDKISGTKDSLKISQKTEPALTIAVQQALMQQLSAENAYQLKLPVKPAQNALAGRGGLRLSFTPKLSTGLAALQDWYRRYPYSCLEQQAGRFVVLRDVASWQELMQKLPTYIARDGLLQYFPVSPSYDEGSVYLTSYILNLAWQMQDINVGYRIADGALKQLLNGLERFVDGKISYQFYNQFYQQKALVGAIETLAHYGRANRAMLEKLNLNNSDLAQNTAWLISLTNIARELKDPQLEQQSLAKLRAQLNYQGRKVMLRSDPNAWHYMGSEDLDLAQLILLTVKEQAWREEVPRLLSGFVNEQKTNGVWYNTVANTYASIMLEKFARQFEKEPVTGVIQAEYGKLKQNFAWQNYSTADAATNGVPSATEAVQQVGANQLFFPHPTSAEQTPLIVQQQGTGAPWLTVENLAAVKLTGAVSNGIQVRKEIIPLQVAKPGSYTKGDVLAVKISINSQNDLTWVAVNDPVPAGASILGSGLGREDSSLEQAEVKIDSDAKRGWTAYVERDFTAYRHYYAWLPKGKVQLVYKFRLNNAGEFVLPNTIVEALYAPEINAQLPNQVARVNAE